MNSFNIFYMKFYILHHTDEQRQYTQRHYTQASKEEKNGAQRSDRVK